MNNLTLDGQFLDELTNEQKGVLWNYFNILNTPIAIDDEVEQVTEIWEKAESDPTLCKWLELIDYFCTNVEELDEQLENDQRAYYSEHLPLLVRQQLNPGSKLDDPIFIPEKVDFCVFMCPNNSGYVRIPVTSNVTLAELDEKVCQLCNRRLGDHQISNAEKPNLR